MIDRYRFRGDQPEHDPGPPGVETHTGPYSGSGEWGDRLVPYPDLPQQRPRPLAADIIPFDWSPIPTRNQAVAGPSLNERSNVYTTPPSGPDDIEYEINGYIQHQQMSPEERRQDWIEENIWKQGLTVDMGTGEIIDPETGQAVGRLPNFE